jgi:hypothetical protein
MTMTVARPAADEYADSFAGYVSRAVDLNDAGAVLASQRDRVVATVGSLTDSAAEHRYAPGKWSIKEMVGHVSDAERIFAYRLLRIGRGDATPLPGFDEDDYARAAGANTRSIGDLVEEWTTVRGATMTLVAGMPAEAWLRRGTSNGRPISARALLYIVVGHVDHHLNVLHTRYL